MFENKIIKANEEIKKVVDYLKEHEEAFQSMNLKLYDACYYFMSDEMKKDFPLVFEKNEKFNNNEYNIFNWFCEDNYNFFEEDLKGNFGIDFSKMCHHIGHTSSFYLHDCDIIDFIDLDNTIYNIMANNIYYDLCIETINNKINESRLDELLNDNEIDFYGDIDMELDYTINDLYNDTVTYCKDIIVVYNIIKNFKDNQVKYFKEYLKLQEEILEDEKEEKEKIEKENKDNCIRIKEKYNISNEDMKILEKCIVDYE